MFTHLKIHDYASKQQSRFILHTFGMVLYCLLLLPLAMALSIPSPSSKMKMSPSYHYEDKASYIAHLQTICPLPAGFQCSFAKTSFTPVEAPQMKDMPITLTLIKMCSPTSNWAAVFTKNTFPGAPVIVGKALLLRREPLQAIVVNNKVSNVCAGGDGISDVLAVSEAVAQELELTGGARSVLASSTGVIGWRVPRQEVRRARAKYKS